MSKNQSHIVCGSTKIKYTISGGAWCSGRDIFFEGPDDDLSKFVRVDRHVDSVFNSAQFGSLVIRLTFVDDGDDEQTIQGHRRGPLEKSHR
jgi:hypothetical protein